MFQKTISSNTFVMQILTHANKYKFKQRRQSALGNARLILLYSLKQLHFHCKLYALPNYGSVDGMDK